MRFEFVHAEKANFPIALMCRLLEVSRSGYYASRCRPISARGKDTARLEVAVAVAHSTSRQTYGSPRIHAELQAQGLRIARKRVAPMRQRESEPGTSQA